MFIFLQTKLYTEDWIGLKTLDEAGKVKFISVPGNHLQISRSNLKKYVIPYLEDEASKHMATVKPSSHRWSSFRNFITKLAWFSKDKTASYMNAKWYCYVLQCTWFFYDSTDTCPRQYCDVPFTLFETGRYSNLS